MEDFDEKVRTQMIYEEEVKSKGKTKAKALQAELANVVEDTNPEYFPYASTLLLWALAPDDSSAEWFRIIDTAHFGEALKDKEIYKGILNQKD